MPDFSKIPEELSERDQWVVWRLETRKGKPTKVLYNARTGRNAKSNNPKTWTSFDVACRAVRRLSMHGIGYVFSPDDPYAGADMDGVRDPETSAVEPWAQDAIDRIWSYTEISQSGRGFHIIVEAKLPGLGHNKNRREMYDSGRYFCMTGNHLPGTPTSVQPRQAETEALYHEWFPQDKPTDPARKPTEPLNLDDQTLLDKMFSSARGGDIQALWQGDIDAHQGDDSRADLALCSHLAFWCQGDAARIDTMFRQSGLMRDKWSRADYRERTITKALKGAAFYDPNYGRGDIPNKGASMWQGNGAVVDEAENVTNAEIQTIEITTDTSAVIDAAEAAIMRLDPPIVFQRTRSLAIITKQAPKPKWMKRDQDTPTIIEVSPEFLWELCSKTANWEKFDKRSKEMMRALPPKWVAQTMLKRPGWQFPLLAGIITSPTLRPDGSVIEQAGYDPDTGLYLDMNSTKFPPVPPNPTFEDTKAAQGKLQSLFEEFDYEDEGGLSAVLAAILTILCRHLIDGPVPMWVFSGTKPGSGKTLLARCVSLIGTGRSPSTYSQTSDDEEERKRLFTIAMHGDPVAMIDNITQPLGSSALNMVLTTEEITDRILGANKQATVPWNAVLMGTGNNVTLKGDMFRRVMPVKLDPMVANPEARTDFSIKNLEDYVKANRAELVVAGLTIIKAFMHEGKPQTAGLDEIGGFQAWNHLIRHCLVWLECSDPAATRYSPSDDSDPTRSALSRLVETWHECYGSHPQTLRAVIGDIGQQAEKHGPGNKWNDLEETLGEFDSSYESGKPLNSKKLGKAFLRHHGFMVSNLRFEKSVGDTHRKVQMWRVRAV